MPLRFVHLFVLVSAGVAVRTIYVATRRLKAPYMLELPQPSEAVTAFLTANSIEAMLVESAPGMSTHTAAEAAAALGIGSEENRVIKSLVCIAGSGVPLVVLLCGSDRLDLRALSRHMRCRARLATATEALELTGFPIGSIPPFSMLQASTLQAIMDTRVLEQPSPVYAGGGQDGLHVCLSPAELQRATRSFVGEFVMAPAPLLSAPFAPPLAPPPPPPGPLSSPWPPAADWWVAPSAADAAALVRLRDEREREGGQIAADGPSFVPDQTPENSSLKPEVAAALAASSAYAGAYVTLPRAEVLRVRRQARLLVFATLRLLEPVVVEEDEEVAASYGPSYGPDGRPFAPPPITPPPITPPPLAVMELGSWPAPLVTARQMRQLALVTALAILGKSNNPDSLASAATT